MQHVPHADPGARPRARRVPGLLALLLVALATPQRLAAAGSCESCPEPTLEQIAADPAFHLEVRPGPLGPQPDTVHTDGGECVATPKKPPTYTLVNSWIVLRGRGEVWDCPHSKSCEKVVAQISEGDSSEWTTTEEGSLGLSAFGATVSGKLAEALKSGFRVETVTRIEKDLCAKWCHRVTWHACFEVGQFRATVEVGIERRYAWWTKNFYTGDAVHAKGDVHVGCADAELTFTRTVPIGGTFHLHDRPCDDSAECAQVEARNLGYFPPTTETPPPPPPPGVPPVVTPPSGGDEGDPPAAGTASGSASDPAPRAPAPEDGHDDWGDPPAGPVRVVPEGEGWVEPVLPEGVR